MQISVGQTNRQSGNQPASWTVYGVNYGVTCFCAERNVTLCFLYVYVCVTSLKLPVEFIYLRYVCALQLDCLFIVPFRQVERRRGTNNCHSARKPQRQCYKRLAGSARHSHIFFGALFMQPSQNDLCKFNFNF